MLQLRQEKEDMRIRVSPQSSQSRLWIRQHICYEWSFSSENTHTHAKPLHTQANTHWSCEKMEQEKKNSNLLKKQKETHRFGEGAYGCQEEE